jgi:hypothetical protein
MERYPRRAATGLVAVLAALGAGACAPRGEAPAPSPAVGRSEAPPVCLQGETFVAEGPLPVPATPAGDARRISALRWSRHPGCERLVIDLAAESGAPASRPGAVSAELLRPLGVVRLTLPGVTMVDPRATEGRFDGPLAAAAYVFFSADGLLGADLHLGAPAEAHVSVLEAPARVVIDLRPGGAPLPRPVAAGQHIVVLEPRPGPASYPLAVSGYARQFEANVVARLEQGGREVALAFTTAAGWLDSWGAFELALEEGPAGSVVLHVGDFSARDGAWEGVAVALEMR